MSRDDLSVRPIVVILNPKSGSGGKDFRRKVEKALREQNANYEVWETTPDCGGSELAEKARMRGATEVIACGGDGTVMAVINGLGADAESTLAIVPGGTANLMAAALDIPTDIDEAVEIALKGRVRRIDLGRRDETLFALGIGVGLTERLVEEAHSQAKERFGRWAYLMAMLKEVGVRPSTFQIKLDDGELKKDRGVAVVIANAGELGSGMRFAPHAKLDDGLLDVCILRRFNAGDVIRIGFRTIFGRLPQDRALIFYQARRIELHAHPPLAVQIDGEVVEAKTPIKSEVLPGALQVRVPPESSDA